MKSSESDISSNISRVKSNNMEIICSAVGEVPSSDMFADSDTPVIENRGDGHRFFSDAPNAQEQIRPDKIAQRASKGKRTQ